MPPLLVKANPTTVFKFDLKPFAMIELSLSLGDPAVACCVTLDNRTPEDALEVHEWVLGYLGLICGDLCVVQSTAHGFARGSCRLTTSQQTDRRIRHALVALSTLQGVAGVAVAVYVEDTLKVLCVRLHTVVTAFKDQGDFSRISLESKAEVFFSPASHLFNYSGSWCELLLPTLIHTVA